MNLNGEIIKKFNSKLVCKEKSFEGRVFSASYFQMMNTRCIKNKLQKVLRDQIKRKIESVWSKWSDKFDHVGSLMFLNVNICTL